MMVTEERKKEHEVLAVAGTLSNQSVRVRYRKGPLGPQRSLFSINILISLGKIRNFSHQHRSLHDRTSSAPDVGEEVG